MQKARPTGGIDIVDQAKNKCAIEQRRRERRSPETTWRPAAQKAQNREEVRILGAIQQPLVPITEGLGTGRVSGWFRALRRAAEPKNEVTVVPEEEWPGA
ncbi:hypothetical protein [Azospirillum melinis]